MKHLKMHYIFKDEQAPMSTVSSGQSAITSFLSSTMPPPTLNQNDSQELFEYNLVQWIVRNQQPFTAVEALYFRQIFNELPGFALEFRSAKTVKSRITHYFNDSRAALKNQLDAYCSTIAFSLNA